LTRQHIRVGTMPYDTTQALLDGSVRFEGVDATVETAPIASDIFRRVIEGDLDVAELGLTLYLRTLDLEAPPLVAVPVFPARIFRHSSMFVNTRSGIDRPEDIVGRTIGEFGMYGQDSGVWVKGILADDFGVTPDRCRWVVGGLDHPMEPWDFIPQPHPSSVDVTPADRALGDLLADGAIDALVSANAPDVFLDGHPDVRRLFPDYEAVERDWYRRTGIFPIMHTVVIRRDLVDADPHLARSVYDAYLAAKNAAADRYRAARKVYQVRTMLPWANALQERDADLFPDDWWPYGTDANRVTLETFLRYHRDQGLSARDLEVDDLFAAI
jgi:hypothetical protein